jgi:hypothetical protein
MLRQHKNKLKIKKIQAKKNWKKGLKICSMQINFCLLIHISINRLDKVLLKMCLHKCLEEKKKPLQFLILL